MDVADGRVPPASPASDPASAARRRRSQGTAHVPASAAASLSASQGGGPARAGGGSKALARAAEPGSDVEWEKVLWKRQPFPDTYTDETFLQQLVVNDSVPDRRFWPVVAASGAVTQQLSCVVALAAVALLLREGRLGAEQLLAACALLLALGYATCALLGRQLLGGSVARGARQCVLLVGGVYGLTPLLHSLTATVSTDSALALAVALSCAHLFLADYSFVNDVTDRLTGALSLAAGVLAAVLVAGRMRTEAEVFAHVLLSLELFLLSPYARRHVRRSSTAAHAGLTAAMAAAAAALLWPLSPPSTAAFLAAVAAVTLAVPTALVRGHRFKAKISGPWDEAAPHIPTELVFGPNAMFRIRVRGLQ
ncbi:hypothetical protein HYH03_016575 [Edaphochlamys debaryana]|uniref:Phosphatidylinositol N-acetylglucosaminyltransferase subunit C n=1 Tax=Edaphochlamys debaryana TaxID=47281 RepID=A0A835XIW0_9CHLO|nr:hypothetical protein HYH03_016575 [Edaphochlamys debaryana]|eukprot:KAG2484621.1 hypothetical protein HYH03_016575 [Edaphochlamys debaryana]